MKELSEMTDEELLEWTKDWNNISFVTECRACGAEFEARKNERYRPDCREEKRQVNRSFQRMFYCRGTLRIWREN